MALMVDLRVTTSTGGTDRIEVLEVKRLTRLVSRTTPADEVHAYSAVRYSPDGETRESAEFRHRYGDGAWVCTLRALMALALKSNDAASRVPLREVDLAWLEVPE